MSADRASSAGRRSLLVVHGHRDGNAVGGQSEISPECVARVMRAQQVARTRRIERVLLCGAGTPGYPSEARQMAALWDGPPIRIMLDERSSDSAENADRRCGGRTRSALGS